MFRTVAISGLLMVCVAPSLAIAQTPYVNLEQRLTREQLHATGLDTLSPAQLDQLNRLLREAPVSATAPAAGSTSANASSSASTSAEGTPVPAILIGLDESPVRSRVKGLVDGWEPGTVFELENGEKWKVLKGSMKLPETLESPPIEVIAGVAGRWFFQVDEDLPKARVYRIQ